MSLKKNSDWGHILLERFRHLVYIPIFCLVIFLFLPLIWGVSNVPPRAYLGDISLAGNKNDLERKVQKAVSDFEKEGLVFVFKNKKVKVKTQDIDLKIDTVRTVNNLKNSLGLQEESPLYLWRFWQSALWGFQAPIFYSFNVDKIDQIMKDRLSDEIVLLVDAKVIISDKGITVTPSQSGIVIDKDSVASQVIRNLKNWQNQEIEVSLISQEPEVTGEEALAVKNEIEKVISHPFSFRVLENNFPIDRKTLLSWIKIQEDSSRSKIQVSAKDDLKAINNIVLTGQNWLSFRQEKKLTWDINKEAVKNFLEQEVKSKIYQEKKNGVLVLEGGVLKESQPSQNEVTVEIDKSLEVIAQALKNNQYFISLPIVENYADISLKRAEELGIKTLVSRGESNFTGSPTNRRHNIKVGAAKFNGVVLGKEEEFSFIKNLGPVDASTGYLPELVIKKDKTVPEFGGGMCQVSSTCFRAAVNGGLRTTERQNHAYPVQYYSPQGTDATVYIPKPDLKFINNTPGPILIQTRMEGNMLYFDFFGQSDDRRVDLEGPRVWDKKSDGSMKTEWVQKVYDKAGNLMFQKNFLSKYDSPSKYPHPGDEKPPVEKKKKKKGGT